MKVSDALKAAADQFEFERLDPFERAWRSVRVNGAERPEPRFKAIFDFGVEHGRWETLEEIADKLAEESRADFAKRLRELIRR